LLKRAAFFVFQHRSVRGPSEGWVRLTEVLQETAGHCPPLPGYGNLSWHKNSMPLDAAPEHLEKIACCKLQQGFPVQ
jgi:hypothetical protein